MIFPTRRDVAAFQMEAVHEDISAGFFKVCSEIKKGVYGYYNRRIEKSRGDFFAEFSLPRIKIEYPELEGRTAWDTLAQRVAQQKPKVLYFNTFQRTGIANWARQFDLPTIGIIHNPKMFCESDECIAYSRRKNFHALVLGDHVRDALLTLAPHLEERVSVYLPYYWTEEAMESYDPAPEVLQIAVPGAVSFQNRDFEGLLDYLSSADLTAQRRFRLLILAGGPDRARLESIIDKRRLKEFFDLAPLNSTTKRVPHSDYLRKLSECHAVLPLLPASRSEYVKSKVTTGIMAGIGTAKPIITTRTVADAYRVDCVMIPDDRPFDIGAANLSPSHLSQVREATYRLRTEALGLNKDRIGSVFSRLLGQSVA